MSDGKTALGLDGNVGALICYIPFCAIGLIYSIIVLVTDKTNKLPRFHALQSLLLNAAVFVVYMLVMIVGVMAATANSTILGLMATGLYLAVFLGAIGAIIFCCIKAFQGQLFKLPVIGDLADKWSN